jgi:hypothetical protein
MTNEDIIRMAHEAGLCDANGEDDDSVNISRYLERFARQVVANTSPKFFISLAVQAEREACAKVCDGWPDYDVQGLAEAIRARGTE